MTRVSRDDGTLDLGGCRQDHRSDTRSRVRDSAVARRRPSSDIISASITHTTPVYSCWSDDVGATRSRSLAPRTSALVRAVQRGNYRVLAKLLEPSNSGQEGGTNASVIGALLNEASGREHLDCVELLLQRMTRRPKRSLKRRGYFPMHTAAGTGAIESIELLISAGLSPKTKDIGGRTPLHHAAGNGSAECTSFLCAVARSTALSRDRVAGDTPLHLAVAARHTLCIQVLLSHTGEEITHEANARGDTPLDMARTLSDDAVLWALRGGDRFQFHGTTPTRYVGQHYGGERRRSGFDRGVNIERIMAVWERFFENAATACLDPESVVVTIDRDCDGRHGRASPVEIIELDADGGVESYHEPQENCHTVHARAVHRSKKAGGRSGNRGNDERRTRVDNQCLDNTEDIKVPHLEKMYNGLTIHCGAWELGTLDHLLDETAGGDRPRSEPAAWSDVTSVELDGAGDTTVSDNLSTFGTPKNVNRDRDWAHSDVVISTEGEEYDTTSAATGLPSGEAWMACWDAASEAVYYWNSTRGDVSWNPPNTRDRGSDLRCRVWDPRQEAFFTFDEWGDSHWILDDFVEMTDTAGGDIGAAVPAIAVGGGKAGSQVHVPCPPQEHVVTSSPSDCDDNLYAASGEGNLCCGGKPPTNGWGTDKLYPVHHSVSQIEPSVEAQKSYDGVSVLFNAQERSMKDPFRAAARTDEHEMNATNAEEEEPRESQEAAAGRNVDETLDDIDFFDARACQDEQLESDVIQDVGWDQASAADGASIPGTELASAPLPAWVLWCPQASEIPSYFVDQETGESSWVLPPAVVVRSKGWLRAWSEEHGTWFYANHWTGTVTWELNDADLIE